MDLLINPIIKNFLISKIEDDNSLNQSLLFWGEPDIGKLTTAKLFAKSLLCLEHKIGGCDQCESCNFFNNQWHPDYLIVDLEADTIKVDDTSPIFDFLLYRPQISKKRVLIINNCEKLNIETQSSLLKVLEEPKNNTIIILITTNPRKLLKTINSRLLSVRFTKPKQDEIISFVEKKYPNNLKNLPAILDLSYNHPARVINYLQNPEALKTTNANLKLLTDLSKNSFCEQSKIIKQLIADLQQKEENDQSDSKDKFIKTYLKIIINDWINNIEKEIRLTLNIDKPLISSKIKQLKNTVQLLSYVDNYNTNYRLLLETFCITTF